jgi:dTDP-4-dehydrorhamnose 3,5-epimerase|tara:strand:- start:1876 stop:2412 length:537 start_codon:yes stop_codon:yes gene_type:complete
MKIIETNFRGLLIIEHSKFNDDRGFFKEIFKLEMLEKKYDYRFKFIQENLVKSYKMVLRGLHFQNPPYSQSKLISVFKGEIFDIAVDLRKDSATYGKYFSMEISEFCNRSLIIPKGFAHGYLTLSDEALINYKVDNIYNKKSENGIMFNDMNLNIDWGYDHSNFIVSKKDKSFKNYKW